MEPMDTDDWLKSVEKKLQVVQCNNREKVLLASHQLSGPAADWWDAYVEAHEEPESINWPEFDIRYQPAKAVKGQASADLIAEKINTNIATLSVRAWATHFDRSACEDGCGIGILLVPPWEVTYSPRARTSCRSRFASVGPRHLSNNPSKVL
jgi:hypothetical protein